MTDLPSIRATMVLNRALREETMGKSNVTHGAVVRRAARAGFRTLSSLVSPTHFHEEFPRRS
jgi:hypothetical protein